MKHSFNRTKVFVVAAVMFVALGTANAQESKAQRFEFGVETGLTGHANYSSASLFMDAEKSYVSSGYGLHFGWLLGRNMVGIHLKGEFLNTSAVAVNEQMLHWALSAMYHYYMPLGSRFEVFAGAKLGAGYWLNTYDFGANHYSENRWGTVCDLDLGVNCKLTEKSHIGICWTAASFGSVLSNPATVPTGLTANDKNNFFGYGIMMHYGLRF